ncbi:MAG: hypothetical protein RLZZ528_1442 [Pseudomonadota bacterium]
MKPSFALSLSQDGVHLFRRRSDGWALVGTARPEGPAFDGEMAALRARAGDGAATTKLILPNSQILYAEVDAPGPDRAQRRQQIAKALDGRTPYALDDLVFDWSGTGRKVMVAVVARVTLDEAEAFAEGYGFAPVSFVAAPDDGRFAGEPWFGTAARVGDHLAYGERVDRDQDPVRLRDAAPEDGAAAPAEPTPSAADETAPTPLAAAEPVDAAPAAAEAEAEAEAEATSDEAPFIAIEDEALDDSAFSVAPAEDAGADIPEADDDTGLPEAAPAAEHSAEPETVAVTEAAGEPAPGDAAGSGDAPDMEARAAAAAEAPGDNAGALEATADATLTGQEGPGEDATGEDALPEAVAPETGAAAPVPEEDADAAPEPLPVADALPAPGDDLTALPADEASGPEAPAGDDSPAPGAETADPIDDALAAALADTAAAPAGNLTVTETKATALPDPAEAARSLRVDAPEVPLDEAAGPPKVAFASRRRRGAKAAARTLPPLVREPAPPAGAVTTPVPLKPVEVSDPSAGPATLSPAAPPRPIRAEPRGAAAAPKSKAAGKSSALRRVLARAASAAAQPKPLRSTPKPPAQEAEELTIFGARGDARVGGKPRYLGLILTAALLAVMAAVALLPQVLGEGDSPAVSGEIASSTAPTVSPTPAARPETDPAPSPDAQPGLSTDPEESGDVLPPEEESDLLPADEVTPDETSSEAAVEQAAAPAPGTEGPGDPVVSTSDAGAAEPAAPQDDTAAAVVAGAVAAGVAAAADPADAAQPEPQAVPEPAPVAEPVAPADQTAAAAAPDAAPAASPLPADSVALAGAAAVWGETPGQTGDTDTRTIRRDAGDAAPPARPSDLPEVQPAAADRSPVVEAAPVPFGSLVRLGPDGLVVPTPDGVLAPGGYTVFAGKPPLAPAPRPEGLAPAVLVVPEVTDVPTTDPAAGAGADPAAAATDTALPPPLPGIPATRPLPRPAGAAAQDDAGLAPPVTPEVALAPLPGPADPRHAALKPRLRPEVITARAALLQDTEDAIAAAAAAAATAQPAQFEGTTRLAVESSQRPSSRPSSVSAAVEAALAAVAAEPAPTVEAASADTPSPEARPADAADATASAAASAEIDEPEPVSAAPDIPTRASVAKQATIANAIDLGKINLIGVYGSSGDRRALVRTSNGRFLRVKVGDRLDGGQVAAIGEAELSYTKGGRTIVLKMIRDS